MTDSKVKAPGPDKTIMGPGSLSAPSCSPRDVTTPLNHSFREGVWSKMEIRNRQSFVEENYTISPTHILAMVFSAYGIKMGRCLFQT